MVFAPTTIMRSATPSDREETSRDEVVCSVVMDRWNDALLA
jgi:hypothetical protein